MSLLLAPYSNAMRLGQGFNSYSQQICVDDAVVIDHNRAENIVTNDGTTMRIVAQAAAKPSAWNRQREVLMDNRGKDALIRSKLLQPKDEGVDEDGDRADSKFDGDDDEEGEEEDSGAKGKFLEEPNGPAESKAPEKAEDSRETASSKTLSTFPDQIPKQKPVVDANGKFGADDSDEKADGKGFESSKALIEKLSNMPGGDDRKERKKNVTTRSHRSASANFEGNGPVERIEQERTQGDRESAELKDNITPLEALRAYKQNNEAKSKLEKYQKNEVASDSIRQEITWKGQTKVTPRKRASSLASNHSQSLEGASYALKPKHYVSAPKSQAQQRKGLLDRVTGHRKAIEAQKAAEEFTIEKREEKERLAEQRKYQLELEKEEREEERTRRAEERKEQSKIREEKREWDKQRREENRQAIKQAADLKALSLQDLEKIKAQNQFADRFTGMIQEQKEFTFEGAGPRGPSQTVVYSSKFIDRLSDITDDMCVSGSLSIKASKIGGSGRGSFVDSDKFKHSDLNFYISVKVINQSINFKDALIFNPLRSVNAENFSKVYGDSFISGFLEGGEFNAVVSMKVLNKAKMTDIKAEAKVAFTAGPIDITAEANVGIARSNIETNTETTIQVSWCGGGHIKPMEQQWDINSLMQAASRFPDLVADCPQRTYAILTKYESLRSFIAMQPASFTPLQYENAQIYTNALMDSFMSYKLMYKTLGEQIFTVQGKTLEIVPWETKDAKSSISNALVSKNGSEEVIEDLGRFEASIRGLSEARKAIRFQMMRIVNEVDLIEKDPKRATDEDHKEPFQAPVIFATRLPDVVIPESLRPGNDPLTGKRIMAKTQTEDEAKAQLAEQEKLAKVPELYLSADGLTGDEKTTFDNFRSAHPDLSKSFRVTAPLGASDKGQSFNNLEFLQGAWVVDSIVVEIAKGAVAALEISYSNGVLLKKGKTIGGHRKELSSFALGERIISAAVEHGSESGITDSIRILSLRLYTNRGRQLLAQASKNDVKEPGKVEKDGQLYEHVTVVYFDCPFNVGTLKGFYGRSDPTGQHKEGIARLGLIWGKEGEESTSTAATKELPELETGSGYFKQNDIGEADLQFKYNELQAQIKEQKSKDLDPTNNLPLSHHGKSFYILNAKNNRIGLNFNGDLRSERAFGWAIDLASPHMMAALEKTNAADPRSPWTIHMTGQNLYLSFDNSSTGLVPLCRPRWTGSESQKQEWYIGINPADTSTIIIQHAHFNTVFELVNCDTHVNGIDIRAAQRGNNDPRQAFVIWRCL